MLDYAANPGDPEGKTLDWCTVYDVTYLLIWNA